MTTPAEQYRALVKRLESISEARPGEDLDVQHNEPPLKIGDIDPRNGKKILSALTSSDGTVVRSRYGDIWNVKYGEPDKKEEPVVAPSPEVMPTPQAEVKPDVKPEPSPEPTPSPEVKPEVDTKPEVKCGPEAKAQIKAAKTFNQAYAIAKKAECPDFDWCQIVTVPQVDTKPTAPSPVTTNPMGDVDPTAFSGDFTKVREEDSFVPGSEELARILEIAGRTVVYEADTPEIKAPSKQAAIEIAKKKGITRFKFCGKYKVQASKTKPKPRPQVDTKPTAPSPVTTNPMGDVDPTAFSGDFTKVRR